MSEYKDELKERYDILLDELLEEYQESFLAFEPEMIVASAVELFLAEAFVRGLKFLIEEPTEKEIEYLESYGLEDLVIKEIQEFPDMDPETLMNTYFEEVDTF